MTVRRIRATLRAVLPDERADRLVDHVSRLPDPHGALKDLRRLAAGALPTDIDRLRGFLTLAGFSPYLGNLMVNNPGFLETLPSGGPGRTLPTREDLDEVLARFHALQSDAEVSLVLRRFKQREYVRIALADFLGTADLPTITRALSLLADVLLDKAVRIARAPLDARYGRPASRGDHGHLEESGFVVIALGKLGGEELNYSSDIDLLYLYSRDGETPGTGTTSRRSITNHEFFTRLAARVTELIGGHGPEGQAFRVDLNLRPGGRDGDLVVSIGSAAAYYRNWAEPWERQALIKARPVAGDLELGHRFLRTVEPLVYEAAPDPYLTVEIGAMKDRIDARLSAQGRSETDIKLGRGGIREIEFAVQALQLRRGGADPWLRQGNTLLALHRLADRGLLSFAEYAALSQAYTFLRHLEHRLQLGQDRQTAVLPSHPARWRVLARRMRLSDAVPGAEEEELGRHLENHRRVVRTFYDSVLGRSAQLEIGEGIPDLWLDRLDDASLLERLRQAGLPEPETALQSVKTVRRLLQPAAVTRELQHALRRTGPFLLHTAVRTINPRRALGNLEKLFSSLLSDPDDLLHFLSHREILGPTVQLLGRSDLLAGLLIRQPGILRRLEDRSRILKTPDAKRYRDLLLEPGQRDADVRSRVGEMRRRHQDALATIALRDINRQATLREILKSLSNLADATLEVTWVLARQEAALQGYPMPAGVRLAVLGLGRLGYREMDYGSDLDLLFIHDGSGNLEPDDLARAARLCESVVSILSTLSRDGQLYKVDLRLRPSGSTGGLLCSVGALVEYFRAGAEVWEMQSFLKARPVAGDRRLGRRAVQGVEEIILDRGSCLDARDLAIAVGDMRDRLTATTQVPGTGSSVKLGRGGIIDIHFAIEFLQLRHGVSNPPDKDTLRLLTQLNRLGRIEDEPMRRLYDGYLFLRSLDHELRLIHDRRLTHLPVDRRRLAELAGGLDPEASGESGARSLLESFRMHTGMVREIYESIVTAG